MHHTFNHTFNSPANNIYNNAKSANRISIERDYLYNYTSSIINIINKLSMQIQIQNIYINSIGTLPEGHRLVCSKYINQ